MTDLQKLATLDYFEDEVLIWVKQRLLGAIHDDLLEIQVPLPLNLYFGEQVTQKPVENVQVSKCNFGQVEIPQGSHKQGLL